MQTLAERFIRMQKENLRKVNNYRFTKNGYEYRISYDGGLSEFISIYGRREGTSNQFRYIHGFSAYKMTNKEQIIAKAEELVEK